MQWILVREYMGQLRRDSYWVFDSKRACEKYALETFGVSEWVAIDKHYAYSTTLDSMFVIQKAQEHD